MAISITSSSSSSVILLVSIVVMTVTSSHAYDDITANDVKDMCFKTDYPEECETFFKHINATDKDAKELAREAVKVSSRETLHAKEMFLAKDREAHDRKWKKIFDSCLEHYYYAARDMDVMSHVIMRSRALDVSDAHLKRAYEQVERCQRLFQDAGHDRSGMKKRNHEVGVALSAARVAVDNLEKKMM